MDMDLQNSPDTIRHLFFKNSREFTGPDKIPEIEEYLQTIPGTEYPIFSFAGFFFFGKFNPSDTLPDVEPMGYEPIDFSFTVQGYPNHKDYTFFGHGASLGSAINMAVGRLSLFLCRDSTLLVSNDVLSLYYTRLGNVLIWNNAAHSLPIINGKPIVNFSDELFSHLSTLNYPYTVILFDESSVKAIGAIGGPHSFSGFIDRYIFDRLSAQGFPYSFV